MARKKWHIEGSNLHIDIAGVRYHVEFILNECGEFEGYIEPEPTNPHDCNAIKVCKDDGTHVGYIPRELTEMVRMVIGERKFPCHLIIKPQPDSVNILDMEGEVVFNSINVYALNAYNKANSLIKENKITVVKPKSPVTKTVRKPERNNYNTVSDYTRTVRSYRRDVVKEPSFMEQYGKAIITCVVVVGLLFVVLPWIGQSGEQVKQENKKESPVVASAREKAETAMDMAAENDMVVMDADNGLRFDMDSKKLEKLIVSKVRNGEMSDNNTLTFKLHNGKEIDGHFKPYFTYGIMYKYELEFVLGTNGNYITHSEYYDIAKSINLKHTDSQIYHFGTKNTLEGTIWIKDNLVIECYFSTDPNYVSLTYSNQPIAYNVRCGNDDYVKRICKSMKPQRDAHVHNSKYGGVVMEVRTYMLNKMSYEPVEWGPVVKKNNAYYVRHMYYTWNAFHEKVLKNCMFRMDLDGEVVDVYEIKGTEYVYK